MARPSADDWPFAWPPEPSEPLLLWLPELPGAVLEAVESALPEVVRASCVFEDSETLSLRSRGGGALVLDRGDARGGALISVHVKRRLFDFPLPSFDDLRYPLAFSLGAAFVFWLGLNRAQLVPMNVYEGCFRLLVGMSALMWTMALVSFYRDARARAARHGPTRLLESLGTSLHQLGARPVPVTENPFRR